MPHHVRPLYRLLVVGGDRVGKTAIIEQLVFGNHVPGQVLEACLYLWWFVVKYKFNFAAGWRTHYWRHL